MDTRLRALARWEVDYDERTVRSRTCRRQTTNKSEVCKACLSVAKDPSLKDAVHRVRDRFSPWARLWNILLIDRILFVVCRKFSSLYYPRISSMRFSKSVSSSRQVSCAVSTTVLWKRNCKILCSAVCSMISSATTTRGASYACTKLLWQGRSHSSR